MGLHSRKANKGKNYRLWNAGPLPEHLKRPNVNRQRMRVDCWTEAQKNWRIFRASDGKLYPRDDRGVMPRKTRRSIAREIFRKAFKQARKVQLEAQAKQA